jgi:hypothetical protein
MNLLIFDQNFKTDQHNYIKPLTDNIKGFKAKLYKELQKAKDNFAKDLFDFVIIDFNNEEGKEFLKYVISIDATQKIITLGYQLKSSEDDCKKCEELYEKRRLMKPINPVDVYKLIMGFDKTPCKYASRFGDPKLLLNDFINRYDCFTYDESTHLISSKKHPHDYLMKEFINIVEDLRRYNIDHQVVDGYNIKIL